MSFSIIRPGMLTTVQDAGRLGYRQAGVIVSGPMDGLALWQANVLVGNPEEAAGLEITLRGPTIQFEADHLIALTGADLSPTLNGQPVLQRRPVAVTRGCELAFGAARSGCRAYLAIAGGLAVPEVLGSRATYLRAGIGGFQGRALQAGDVVPVAGPTELGSHLHRRLTSHHPDQPWAATRWSIAPSLQASPTSVATVRALRGPEYDRFTQTSQQAFWTQEFTVTPSSDRMGYGLQGPELRRHNHQEILSTAVTFGTVQVPAGGLPIILMADHQTTGGYPRIVQVISTDFSLLAQLPMGGKLRFQEVTLAEAHHAYLHQERTLHQLARAIQLTARHQ
ncbi:biotin-dependent carboxyltransferase family protein [Hymenobacter sp. YC55]|uniref:5-oxoprolinase subunit C family protein n=1 Tax=Hymenobacter sp. YC55 TaxID=3034019 RepID=UPI0023FA3CEB|nr:biotin-dependent carboxyltransferase family protein [Hymenobacter sp. YC55]MDF7811712.1 biotin-dependent carboxyltransferase family protein [Hymenobacter sp. YC55]